MANINRFSLDNGLKVVHVCDNTTKIVAVNILYNVGSKNDAPDKTGYAHLLEHLMFSGSQNVPDFDIAVQQAGGENNAYTTTDITNYYDIMPSQNVETAFWVESDRMNLLTLSEEAVNVQRHVVIEEFKQRNLNQPYGDASQLYHKKAYKKHPYRNMVIGNKISHIADAKLEDIYAYYKANYNPSNAVLSVVGNISFERCKELTVKWFSSIPKVEIAKPSYEKEPLQRRARYLSVERGVPQSAIYKVYHMCDRASELYPSCDLLSDVLANGKSSRLYTQLVVKERLFTTIDASISGDIDEGIFLILGRVASGVTMQEADAAIERVVCELSKTEVSNRELQKVKNKFASNELFGRIGASELAWRLAYYELLGDANLIDKQVDIYNAVTPLQLQNAAKKYLTPQNCTTLYYHAKGKV